MQGERSLLGQEGKKFLLRIKIKGKLKYRMVNNKYRMVNNKYLKNDKIHQDYNPVPNFLLTG